MNIGYTAGIPLNKGKSNEVMLNILEGILPIGGTTFGITSGFGLNWRSYHIEQNKHLFVKDAVTGVYDAPAGVTYRYSRMRTLHLTVPLMIEFQPTMWRRHNFFLTAGVVGGWNVMNTYRVMYDDPSEGRVNRVESRGLQTNPLTLDIMVQIGYSCIGFYAKYLSQRQRLYPRMVSVFCFLLEINYVCGLLDFRVRLGISFVLCKSSHLE